MKATGFMISGGRIVTVHRKLGKEAEERAAGRSGGRAAVFFGGGWKNTGEKCLIGRFGQEERQEDDSVLVVVFVFADCLASC